MVLSLIIFISFILLIIKNYVRGEKKNLHSRLLIKSSITSATILVYWFINGTPSFLIKIGWMKWGLQKFSFSLMIDFPFIIFCAVGIFVTWSIVEFSKYYMRRDPKKKSFIRTLILFLLFMLILVSSKKLFTLFIGWEGVGIMSFVLISWWFTRSDAKRSALQAIIYKRIGDRGMILFLVISMLNFNRWKLKEIIFLKKKSGYIRIAILGIILAAAGKSAQFSLHPWLPAAMEGPTPVSALLHRSTMVVAGVFLLFRCAELIRTVSWAPKLIRIVGAITALFAARVAIVQYDIKKIVAYSTTRQLGLMVVAIGIKIPELALFHICTHAFFKALLFLCSGRIIHKLKKEQDIRKMGKASNALPLTTSCIIIARLALCGLPFLAGYYSKDVILEIRQARIGKRIRIILAMVATLMTAIYRIRMIVFISFPKIKSAPIKPSSEEDTQLSNPITRLAGGVFFSGWLISLSLIRTETVIIPWIKKILPLILLIAVVLIYFNNTNIGLPKSSIASNSIRFCGKNWFFVKILHNKIINLVITYSVKGVLRALDQGWKSFTAIIGVTKALKFISKIILSAHQSVISTYFKFFLLATVAIIIIVLTI